MCSSILTLLGKECMGGALMWRSQAVDSSPSVWLEAHVLCASSPSCWEAVVVFGGPACGWGLTCCVCVL